MLQPSANDALKINPRRLTVRANVAATGTRGGGDRARYGADADDGLR